MSNKKPCCNGKKVVVVLALVGIGYYLYTRSQKQKELERSITVSTIITPAPNLTPDENRGFDILQNIMGWSNQERSIKERSGWYQMLAKVEAEQSKIL